MEAYRKGFLPELSPKSLICILNEAGGGSNVDTTWFHFLSVEIKTPKNFQFYRSKVASRAISISRTT